MPQYKGEFMKKALIVILIFIFAVSLLFSKAILSFETTEHNMGRIKEEGGPYEYTFKFTNKGDTPLKLSKVKAGCGCTVASWSTGIIPPNGKGFVKVVFDSNNRPGAFHKKITVYSKDIEKPIVLHLKGFVIGTPGKFYPKNKIGHLQFDKSYVFFNRIAENEKKKITVTLYNSGKKPLSVQIAEKPDFLSINIAKNTLKPKEKTKMTIICNSAKVKKFGQLRKPIKFILNGKEQKKLYYVRIYRYKDFSKLTQKQKKNAPHIRLINKNISFAHYKSNKSKYDTIHFKNFGKTPLEIYNIDTSDKIKVISFTKSVKPGKIGKIVFRIKNKEKINAFRGYLKIFSNDPSNFERTVTISGGIKSSPKRSNLKKYQYISPSEFWKFKDDLKKYPNCKRILDKKMAKKVIILDVRSSNMYEKEHFKNSVNIPFDNGELENSIDNLDKRQTVYFIIGKDFEQADTASLLMFKNGFKYIFCLKGNYIDFIKFKEK